MIPRVVVPWHLTSFTLGLSVVSALLSVAYTITSRGAVTAILGAAVPLVFACQALILAGSVLAGAGRATAHVVCAAFGVGYVVAVWGAWLTSSPTHPTVAGALALLLPLSHICAAIAYHARGDR